MSTTTQDVIQQTKSWIQSVVIDLNLCPFASQVFIQDQIQYIVIESNDRGNEHGNEDGNDLTEKTLQQLAKTFEHLDNNKDIETSLIIFSRAYIDFNQYLDLVDIGNDLLEDLNYTGIYQLASFHPDYCFADSDKEDASNYSNRSPYPMLHILREDSVEQAISNFQNIEEVPKNNIQQLQNIGFSTMQAKLKNILDFNN